MQNIKDIIEDIWLNFRWRFIGRIKDFFDEVKYSIQRARRGYSDADCWNINDFVAETVPPMLEKVRKDGCGFPMGFKTDKEWKKCLKKMEDGFHAYKKIAYGFILFKEEDRQQGVDYITMKELKALQKKQDEGLALFAKYFGNLWD